MINIGVKKDDIILDSKRLNTEQNALNTSKILGSRSFARPILVISAFHMKRTVLQFKKTSVEVIPCPCDYKTNVHRSITTEDFIDILTKSL